MGSPLNNDDFNNTLKSELIDSLGRNKISHDSLPREKSIEDRIKEEAINNMKLDIELKKDTLYFLLILLGVETFAIFTLVFFQGFEIITIEEWTMRILTVSTITQITVMLNIAVKYLFSMSKSSKKNDFGK